MVIQRPLCPECGSWLNGPMFLGVLNCSKWSCSGSNRKSKDEPFCKYVGYTKTMDRPTSETIFYNSIDDLKASEN